MIVEDDTYVIEGPVPSQTPADLSLGELFYNNLSNYAHTKETALIDAVSGQQLTYKHLLDLTCSLAQALRASGYGKNSMISISSENNLQFFIPVIASLYIGATIAPINHSYTETELDHTLNITKPSIIFCSKAILQRIVNLKSSKLKFIQKIIVIDDSVRDEDVVRGVQSLNQFIAENLSGGKLISAFRLAEIDVQEDVCFVLCSSGTTGLPKGVMLTHSNILVRYLHSIDPSLTCSTGNFLGILPFFHGFGLVTNMMAIILGQKIVVMKRFEEKLFLESLTKYKVERLWLAPPLLVFLAKSPLVSKYDLSFLKEIACGAAPLSRETEEVLIKRLNLDQIRQGYGLTEATLAVLLVPVGVKTKQGSSGLVCPYMKIKVRDPETGKSLGPNQRGEICIKGPMVMKGYYGNVEATRNTFTSDGWLLTGDIGYYDDDKYFYIVDRLKELIKYNSFQVAPAELEAILLKHPEIRDAGVVGLPREDVGELPLAFVVKLSNSKLSEKDVETFVAGHVSSQKRLRGGVIFVDAIPKNPSGKILRRELRKMLTSYKSKL